jgi:hypothetical protein
MSDLATRLEEIACETDGTLSAEMDHADIERIKQQIADLRKAVALIERLPKDCNGEALLPGDYVSGDIGGPGVIISIMRDSLRVITAGGSFCQLPGNVIKEENREAADAAKGEGDERTQ